MNYLRTTENEPRGPRMKTRSMAGGVIGAGMILALASCTNPYDPGQRTVGGALTRSATASTLGSEIETTSTS
jgi:hypothetical protein